MHIVTKSTVKMVDEARGKANKWKEKAQLCMQMDGTFGCVQGNCAKHVVMRLCRYESRISLQSSLVMLGQSCLSWKHCLLCFGKDCVVWIPLVCFCSMGTNVSAYSVASLHCICVPGDLRLVEACTVWSGGVRCWHGSTLVLDIMSDTYICTINCSDEFPKQAINWIPRYRCYGSPGSLGVYSTAFGHV